MRAVRFADECSKWKTPAQTFSSSGALRCARTQTRFAARTWGPLRVLPRRGAQRQKEAREGPHRFQWKFHKVCETCDGVGRSVGELKVRAVRIVNFFCCSRCRSGQLK